MLRHGEPAPNISSGCQKEEFDFKRCLLLHQAPLLDHILLSLQTPQGCSWQLEQRLAWAPSSRRQESHGPARWCMKEPGTQLGLLPAYVIESSLHPIPTQLPLLTILQMLISWKPRPSALPPDPLVALSRPCTAYWPSPHATAFSLDADLSPHPAATVISLVSNHSFPSQ